jgi:hypothetical protein
LQKVEVKCEGEQFSAALDTMYQWLETAKIRPSLLHFSRIPGAVLYEVSFRKRDEANAFAEAFGGRLLSPVDEVSLPQIEHRVDPQPKARSSQLAPSGAKPQSREPHRTGRPNDVTLKKEQR